jgi:hypothetical protein
MRAQRNLDCHECSQAGLSPAHWTPEYIKKHDLLLRYRTTAERSFQRTFGLLEQFRKLHPTVENRPAAPAKPEDGSAASTTEEESEPERVALILGEDPHSPTGLVVAFEMLKGGIETPVPRPYYPPKESPPAHSHK